MPLGIALSIDRTDLATISQSLPLATTGSSDVAAISSPGAAATTGVAALLALFDRAFTLGSSLTVVVAPEEEFDSSAVLVRGRFNPRCGAAVTAGVVFGVAAAGAEGGAEPAGERTGAVVALASIALGVTVGAAMILGVKLTGIAVAMYHASSFSFARDHLSDCLNARARPDIHDKLSKLHGTLPMNGASSPGMGSVAP